MFAITLFSGDCAASRSFYSKLIGADPIHEDDDSVVFRAGTCLINILRLEAVAELIDPLPMATTGIRAVYTLRVPDVDKNCERLKTFGLEPATGPVDRPWGPRIANFCDPSGHVWELSS